MKRQYVKYLLDGMQDGGGFRKRFIKTDDFKFFRLIILIVISVAFCGYEVSARPAYTDNNNTGKVTVTIGCSLISIPGTAATI